MIGLCCDLRASRLDLQFQFDFKITIYSRNNILFFLLFGQIFVAISMNAPCFFTIYPEK
jgi:hypothetical protein